MSFSYNRVCLAGNLTRDPELRTLQGDNAVASFGLAINRKYRSKDGVAHEETTFVDVEAWGRTAELVSQYLTKGRGCFVEGRLKLDTWEKDGKKQSKLKVVADSVQFLGAPNAERDGESVTAAPKKKRSAEPVGGGFDAATDEPPF